MGRVRRKVSLQMHKFKQKLDMSVMVKRLGGADQRESKTRDLEESNSNGVVQCPDCAPVHTLSQMCPDSRMGLRGKERV